MRAGTLAERRGMMISLKHSVCKSGFVLPFGTLRTTGLIFLFIILVLNASPIFSVAPLCNPTSAMLCAAVDDTADIYVNGSKVGTFPYCDKGNASCTPVCTLLTPAQLLLLQDSGNLIALYDQNTATDEIWASWSLDVTCASGHVIVTSDSPQTGYPIKMLHDANCVSPNPSPTPVGGGSGPPQWYDLAYVPNVAWVAPVNNTGQKWGKRIADPGTGSLLRALSFAASYPITSCGALWFREGFDMTPVVPPPPPAFTITKTANPSTDIGQSTPYAVTFTLHICNNGGGTFGNPVVINDNWNDSVDNWQFVGGTYTDVNLGEITASASGKTVTITFTNGFPANTCYDYVYSVTMYSGKPTFCVNWHNTADLSYLSNPIIEAVAPLSNHCPGPPNFTLLKTANKTTGIVQGDNINFNLHLCNIGDVAWTGTAHIVDDYSSSSPDSWNYTSSTYFGGPATGINHISVQNNVPSLNKATFDIVFEQPGFIGCIDIPMTLLLQAKNPGGCTWHNDAFFSYFTSPTVVSTVPMADLCTPTFTVTPTRTSTNTLSPTRTYTPSVSATFTQTPVASSTNTPSPTFTSTATPVMHIIKTVNVGIATFGDVITYTLAYNNPGTVAANPVCIYDAVPAQITYINSSVVPTTGAPNLSWCVGNVIAGGNGTITWWGKITSYPFNPFFEPHIYLGVIPYDGKETIATYKKYLESGNFAFAAYVLSE